MAVVSICSTKGGVGKTTLVICLADAFARQGGSVVILSRCARAGQRMWAVIPSFDLIWDWDHGGQIPC